MRKFLDRARREESGFTLIELLVVIVILGILATIVVINVTGAATKAKQSSFKTTLATLQTASDEYYFDNTAYATVGGSGNQPVAGSAAAELSAVSPPAPGDLYNQYLHTVPNSNSLNYACAICNSTNPTMYFGVTATGKTFATVAPPTSNAWTSGSTVVYTQNHTYKGIALSTIW